MWFDTSTKRSLKIWVASSGMVCICSVKNIRSQRSMHEIKEEEETSGG